MMKKKELIAILKEMADHYSTAEEDYIAGDVETAVERWAAEHHRETRQTKFLRQFPHAELDYNGNISICPHSVDITYRDCKRYTCCKECRAAYWGGKC